MNREIENQNNRNNIINKDKIRNDLFKENQLIHQIGKYMNR